MIKNVALTKGNRALLLLALFFGALTAVLVVVYLSRAGKEAGIGGGGGGGVPAVVAAQEIPAGTRITAEMVKVKSIPQDVVILSGFTKSDEVVGQVTRVPLAANEQVSQGKLASAEFEFQAGAEVPLSLVVPEGMRAASVGVDSVIGAGGLVRPGDHVDVILSVRTEVSDGTGQAAGRNQIARIVLQNAEVLAIDQNVVQAVPTAAEGEGGTGDSQRLPLSESEAKPDAVTVTLAVSPVHSEVLALAETCARNFDGRISLALRGFGDEDPVLTRADYPNDGGAPDCARLLGLDFLTG